MSTVLPLFIALAIGFGAALQTSMLGALGRARGPGEAAWLSLLATVCGLTTFLTIRAFRGDPPLLPAPFDRAGIFLVVAVAAAAGIAVIARDVPVYYVITGLFGLAFIFGAAAIVPRIGVALFLATTIAGQLIGAIALDHIGAFGQPVYALSPFRLLGAVMLLGGVVLVRGLGR